MQTSDIHAAFDQNAAEIERFADRVAIRQEPGRLCLYTGEPSVRRSRMYSRAIGIISLIVGSAMLWSSVWGWAVIIFGVIALAVAPVSIRAEKLLELDTDDDKLIIRQAAAGAGVTLAFDHIRSIRGAYDTKGWDGFSILNAVDYDGAQTPILMLLGTDERLAEAVCRILGLLLNCPATYSGPFGDYSVCFAPHGSKAATSGQTGR